MLRLIFAMCLVFCSMSVKAGTSDRGLTAKQVYDYMTGGQRVSAEVKQSIERHFRDSNKYYLDPTMMGRMPMPSARVIQGKNYILTPLTPWSYKFDIYPDKGELIIRTKIHFKNTKAADIERMKEIIQQAEDIWNADAPQVLSFKYRFKFEVVKTAKEGFISVGLLKDTRGPFYSNWSKTWGPQPVAHEIGHMMGLSDEYNELDYNGKNLKCDLSSIMCSGWVGEPHGHHYYHILRKIFKD